jgi:hypothetical protein
VRVILKGNDLVYGVYPAGDEAIKMCKDHTEEKGLDKKDVKMVQTESGVMVKVRDGREVIIERGPDTTGYKVIRS